MWIVAVTTAEPPRLLLLPFFLLLGAIAVAPLVLRTYWERHYAKVCLILPAIVIGYYLTVRDFTAVTRALLDYFNFIVVMGSFFTVAGGIHLRARSRCQPLTNTVFLFLGALLANIFGTIGASIVLIRPWMEMNKTRFAGYHLAFFIFIVSNIGGALLPVGPPLFLGFQKGVPFLWPLIRLWPHWLFVNSVLLTIFFLIDRRQCVANPAQAALSSLDARRERWRLFGKRNLCLMIVLLLALIFLPSPVNSIVMI